MSFVVATIVEGVGDVIATPVLLRRIEPRFEYPRLIRVDRHRIQPTEAFARYIQLAIANIRERGGRGGILIILDADDDCAASIGPHLSEFAAGVAGGHPCGCVVAVKEFEAWLLAGIPDLLPSETDPEAPRDCKAALRAALGRYRPTADQARFAARVDVGAARTRSPSYRKLIRTMDGFRRSAHDVLS